MKEEYFFYFYFFYEFNLFLHQYKLSKAVWTRRHFFLFSLWDIVVKRKTFHRDAIISSSRWFSALYEPRYLMTSLDVVNIRMSVSIQISMAK